MEEFPRESSRELLQRPKDTYDRFQEIETGRKSMDTVFHEAEHSPVLPKLNFGKNNKIDSLPTIASPKTLENS